LLNFLNNSKMRITLILIALLSIGTLLPSCEKGDGGLIESNKKGSTIIKTAPQVKPQPAVITLTESACEGGDDEDPAPLIYGSVYNTDSVLLEGVCVELWVGNTFLSGTGTDDHGHYYFNTVSNGTYSVRFAAEEYYSASRRVTRPTTSPWGGVVFYIMIS
jgi:protocatechuate 3,4-dioxygenase beta subunit